MRRSRQRRRQVESFTELILTGQAKGLREKREWITHRASSAKAFCAGLDPPLEVLRIHVGPALETALSNCFGADFCGSSRCSLRRAAPNCLYGGESDVWPALGDQDTGVFRKNNLETELLYIAGGNLSTAALVSGDVQIAFTGAANVVAANLTGAEVVLLGATIDRLLFEVWAVPNIKYSAQRHEDGFDAHRLDDAFRRALSAQELRIA
jgi:NMT1/THI5 like